MAHTCICSSPPPLKFQGGAGWVGGGGWWNQELSIYWVPSYVSGYSILWHVWFQIYIFKNNKRNDLEKTKHLVQVWTHRIGAVPSSRIHIDRGGWFSLISQSMLNQFYKQYFRLMRRLPWKQNRQNCILYSLKWVYLTCDICVQMSPSIQPLVLHVK